MDKQLPPRIKSYLTTLYSGLTDEELIYEYLQPYCLKCQTINKNYGYFPLYCDSCGTYRYINSPLMKEISYRHIKETYIWRRFAYYQQFAECLDNRT